MTEHAIVMALVAGGVFLGIAALGYMVRSSFDDFAQQMAATHQRLENPHAGSLASSGEPIAQAPVPHPVPWTMRFETWIAFASLSTLFVFIFNMLVLRRAVQESVDEADRRDHTDQIRDFVFDKRQEIFRILASDMDVLLLESRLEARHVMSRRVTAVTPNTPVAEVRETMKERHMRHLLVCRGSNLVGIISDRDLSKRDARTAADLMTANPITVEPHTLLNPIITQMVQRRISCLPVLDKGQIVGVLTSTDLMMTLQCALQVLRRVAGEVIDESDGDFMGSRNDLSQQEDAPVADEPASVGTA